MSGRFPRCWLLRWLVALALASALCPALADESLSYDPNGNILTRTLPGGTTTYGYDDLDRVVSEAGPARTQSFTYDPNDNRLSDGAGTKTYAPNSDRIVSENGQTFTLDAAGNVTSARGLSFTWNQAGQLKSVKQGTTLLASYFYDYKGRRSRKVDYRFRPSGVTTLYVYDLHDRLIAELDRTGGPLRTYVWRDEVPLAIIVHAPNGTESTLYLETDHLGTPIAARDASGFVVWRWESDAFGTTLPNQDSDGDGIRTIINLRFPGQYFDTESGLHYNWHRYYDPQLGRYLSPDPVGLAGGRNLYGYASQNPVRLTDPLGLWSVTFGAYLGVGGQITFGNDGGNGFMTGRVGFGLGGGFSYTPDGGIPGPVPQDPSAGGVVLSCSGKANFNAGPLTAYMEKGVARNYNNAESAFYGGAGYSGRDRAWGLNASGSVGGQVTIYSGKK